MEDAEKDIRDIIKFFDINGYDGYDPYDALNSNILNRVPSKYLRILFTQLFVYSPLDLRKIFNVEKGINPKTLGLILQGYCLLNSSNIISLELFKRKSNELLELIIENQAKGYDGHSWGFNFPWQDLTRYTPPNLPTIVNTSIIGHSLLDLHEKTGDRRALEIAEGAGEFILSHINRIENEYGICFSYTPIDNNIVHNASALGTSLIARLFGRTGEYDDLIRRLLDFTLHFQRDSGKWPYSYNTKKGTERMQIDFHQGFIIDSIIQIIEYCDIRDHVLEDKLKNGIEFYLNYQFKDGRSTWRHPKRWPVDIHHQAQGIITSSRYYSHTGENRYLSKAGEILEYTTLKMKKRNGTYTYQKWPFFSNNIQFTRWSEAWMFLAISEYISAGKKTI